MRHALDGIRDGLAHYGRFTGRMRRANFWWFVAFLIIVNMLTNTLLYTLNHTARPSGLFLGGTGPADIIISLLLDVALASAIVRRLRDAGDRWQHVFWYAIPTFITYFLAIMLNFGITARTIIPLLLVGDITLFATALGMVVLLLLLVKPSRGTAMAVTNH